MSLKDILDKLMNENKENFEYAPAGYDKGYAEGYHDALVDVLHKCGYITEETYFD